MSQNDYSSDNIKSLSWQEQARTRPGMWIGSTGNAGVLHLINEAIDNCVDEFTAGFGKSIEIKITDMKNDTQKISVRDYGRGIPVGLNDKGINTLTAAATVMFTGGKYDNNSYKFNAGMNGSGLKLINVFSTVLNVTSYRDGKATSQSFSLGYEKSELYQTESSETGTYVEFIPDKKIFGDYGITEDDIQFRCKCIASLIPGCQIIGIINGKEICNFKEENELEALKKDIKLGEDKPLFDMEYFSEVINHISEKGKEEIPYRVGIKLEYYATNNKSSMSFCNSVYTSDMGSHDDALMRCLRDSLKKITGYTLNNSQISTGLSYVISVFKQNPIFRGQSKTRVYDEDIFAITYKELYPVIHKALSESKGFIKYFTQLIVSQNKLIEEVALKEAGQNIKDSVKNNELPKSLKIAYGFKPQERELLLTEGKSSGGTLKEASRAFQEVLPLRGKVLNTAKADLSRIIRNQEISDIFKAVGGMENTNTPLRTHNVLLLADADSDGCILGSNRIPLLDGTTKTIAELVNEKEFWVYSCLRDGKIVPGHAHSARITKYVDKLYKITLDNDKEIISTDNHPFMLKTGEYKRADELEVGISLMPFNRKFKQGRPMVHDYQRVWIKEQHLVWEHTNNQKIKPHHHIHHINKNILDNRPENLIQLSASEHASLHNEENKEWFGKHISELHKQGVYGTLSRDSITAYNKSDAHRKRTSEVNKQQWSNPAYREKMAIKPCVNVVKKCLEKYGIVNEELYNKERTGNTRKWNNFLDYAKLTSEEVKDYSLNYNHTIKSIEILNVEPTPVYDLTVDEYHNFALEAGVFVHNSHIYACIITLFVKLFPSFIRNYNLYLCHPPLFLATDGVNYEYANTVKQCEAKFKKKYKNKKFQVLRSKGLGELSPDMFVPVIDPQTRLLTKINLTDESEIKIDGLMGKSSEFRRELLESIEGYDVTSDEISFDY